MAKRKLKKFTEIGTYNFVIQPKIHPEPKDISLKGQWKSQFFKNERPITLELACGKGEYSVKLSQKNPYQNFIGVDIKGERIWKGAQSRIEHRLENLGFLRAPIERIESMFLQDEIDEIYIVFPDPFEKKGKEHKRLTHHLFLERYKKVLKREGKIHLKTDSALLYHFTLKVLKERKDSIHFCSENLYRESRLEIHHKIETFYEKMFLKAGKSLKWISFSLN